MAAFMSKQYPDRSDEVHISVTDHTKTWMSAISSLSIDEA